MPRDLRNEREFAITIDEQVERAALAERSALIAFHQTRENRKTATRQKITDAMEWCFVFSVYGGLSIAQFFA